MEAYSIKFDGRMLDRGFWLYVIDIQAPAQPFVWVGRTGDNSSPNAASAFSRLSAHLGPNANSDALARNLRQIGIEPRACTMEMIALGPIFPEELDFPRHRPVRDKIAALERGLADALRQRGFNVMGRHTSRQEPDPEMLSEVVR